MLNVYHALAFFAIALGTLSACVSKGSSGSESTGSGGSGGNGGSGGAEVDAGADADMHTCDPAMCFQPPTACAYAMCIDDLQCGVGFATAMTACSFPPDIPTGECNGSGICEACPLDCNNPTGGCRHGTASCP